jgi:hypothetical protein
MNRKKGVEIIFTVYFSDFQTNYRNIKNLKPQKRIYV